MKEILEFLQTQLVFSTVLAVVVVVAILGTVAYAIYFERKISAWIQDRSGPNRVGFFGLFWNFHFWGLGQPMADGAKFLLKEDIIPDHVEKPLFVIAPTISLIMAMIGFAVIPWGGQVDILGKIYDVQVANPDIGLLYLLGIGSMGIYGVVLGGWASNNKYSMLGGMRSAAQMISYEIPMGIAILVVVLTCGHLRLEEIVTSQLGTGTPWMIVRHPLAAFIFVVTLFAETNRTPFDLGESEQELVGGFHTEYSSMKFAMYFLGEYAHMITGSAVFAVLFLGGWDVVPFITIPGFAFEDTAIWAMLLKMAVMACKIFAFLFFFMWVRWTLPRLRYDQLMRLAWKGLIPMALGLLLVVVVGLYFGLHDKLWFTLVGNAIVFAGSMLAAASSSKPITGRQDNMAPIEPSRKSTDSALGVSG